MREDKKSAFEAMENDKRGCYGRGVKKYLPDDTPFIYTNGKNKSGGSFMDNGAFCLSKSDKVMGVQLCTNAKENGAVSVFFPGVLQRLAQLMESDLYILFTSRNESSIYSVNESNLEDIKDELHIMETDYDNGIWYEDSLSEELYYYSRIEDKLSVYMEKSKG